MFQEGICALFHVRNNRTLFEKNKRAIAKRGRKMKKTILAMLLVVMVSIPCFGQEIEPEGNDSIEGTLWRTCNIIFIAFPAGGVRGCALMGFHQDTVYFCTETAECNPYPSLTYIDSPLISIVFNNMTEVGSEGFELYIMQPMGFGVFMGSAFGWEDTSSDPQVFLFAARAGIVFKVNDDWIPPE